MSNPSLNPRGRGARFENLEDRLLMSTSSFYVQTNLVSDNGVPGTRTDANLVNGWGLAAAPGGGPWWVAAAEKGLSLAFDSTGAQAAANVIIPNAAGQTESNPTGVVANDTGGFVVSSGGNSAASEYVFVTENGTVSGWNIGVDPTHAIMEVDNSASGAVYKGAAIASRKHHAILYAANFHSGRIDLFDSNFASIATKRKAFRDSFLPAGYAPFNVANVDGFLYVTYALQDADAHDDVAGPRHGFVDIYDTSGALVKRFASRGALDSPWGMVVAPHDFGLFSDDILIGNFGNGKISAFNRKGRFMGFVVGSDANPVEIPGLWGLSFGNGGQAGPTNTLFFAAGPDEESHGLFGSLTVGHSHRHSAGTGTTVGPTTGGTY
ncbi:MAG TPA: TIGR03118 family protein [Tepidisphaeraceae bacterium]|jgi:uncharacterized protein (TIGR03118 family)